MKISSSMIAWNEASTIDLTLRSIVGFADEVIIIDTGSFDGTRKIAREWIDRLNLSGQVKQMSIRNLGEARLSSLMLCQGDWILMQDSNLVLSNALKRELIAHSREHPGFCCDIKSLNLMGDYGHYFRGQPFMAPHRIFVERAHATWRMGIDRPHFHRRARVLSNWAVNLSRVRPAWRYWYRGEQFDRRHYTRKNRRWINPANIQRKWMNANKYSSLVEYIEAVKGLTLEDVKKIAPEWYLRQLRIEATALTSELRGKLPEVILEELRSPRYKLIYEKGEITGRWPTL